LSLADISSDIQDEPDWPSTAVSGRLLIIFIGREFENFSYSLSVHSVYHIRSVSLWFICCKFLLFSPVQLGNESFLVRTKD